MRTSDADRVACTVGPPRPGRARRWTAPAAALGTAVLLAGGCSGGATTTDAVSYQVDQPVTALVVDARAASVAIDVQDGPVSVTEEYHYSRGKPATRHQLEGRSLRLTESGCGDDNARCEVGYRIRMPRSTSVDITARAGAVELDGLAGDVHVTTDAGAVEGRALTSAEVTIKTDAGAASLEFAKAPRLVRARTSMGAVHLRLPGTTAYAVDVHTSVGGSSVDVEEDPTSAHRIEVATEVGGVSIDRLP